MILFILSVPVCLSSLACLLDMSLTEKIQYTEDVAGKEQRLVQFKQVAEGLYSLSIKIIKLDIHT